MTTEESVIYLASCAVNGEIPDKELVGEIDPENTLSFAKKHKIGCCVAMALESAGIKNTDTAKTISNAMRRNALFDNSLKEVTAKLEEAGIWYVPLKGIILKKYYPMPFMREMVDQDILIDSSRAADVKEIMGKLGFTTKEFGTQNHDVYYKKPILNYEMHTLLFPPLFDKKVYEYYRNKRDLFRPEDIYLYTVTHEYKHYSRRGTGLRSLLDVYLYLKKERLDWNYVEEEMEKLGIGEFERSNRELAITLFKNGDVTDEEMLSYILSSNAYGTYSHWVENGLERNKGKRIGYMLKRISVPVRSSDPYYKVFANYYPTFYKYRILLPLLPLYRIIRGIKSGKLVAELKTIYNRHI